MKVKSLLIFLILLSIVAVSFFYYRTLTISGLQDSRRVDGIVEPVYTQDCFPRTLQNWGITKKCFEYANLGQNIFCNKEQLQKIKDYYAIGQDKDPLNNGSGQFCAD